jgi:hypothetical protein
LKHIEPDTADRLFGDEIKALVEYLDEIVLVGGWAHRLYRFHDRALPQPHPPLLTMDVDWAGVPHLKARASGKVNERLEAYGFRETLQGDFNPPVTKYVSREHEGFYVEFLVNRLGGPTDRRKRALNPIPFAGATAQPLPYVNLLLIEPWSVSVPGAEFGLESSRTVRLPHPVGVAAQKLLSRAKRDERKRAKDILYLYELVTMFEIEDVLEGRSAILDAMHPPWLKRLRAIVASVKPGSVLAAEAAEVARDAGRREQPQQIAATLRTALAEMFAQ